MAMEPFLFILMISTHRQGFISFLCTFRHFRQLLGVGRDSFRRILQTNNNFHKNWTILFYSSLLYVLRTYFSNPWCFFGQILFSSHRPVCVCVCAIFSFDLFINNSFCQVFWNLFKRKLFLFHLVTRLRHESEVESDTRKKPHHTSTDTQAK